MQPVVSPDEMRFIDAEAPESTAVLIERAGWAIAREALDMLGGGYGKRAVVYCGKGNNGADALVAADFLTRRGVRCEVLSPTAPSRRLDGADLVIDGCVGTGLDRDFRPPPTGSVPVLSVDIPSGVDGLTGQRRGDAIRATRTVTFAALKPGHLLADGPSRSGTIVLADIGLDVSRARAHVIEDADVLAGWPRRDAAAHKHQTSVWVIGGSPGMTGALRLTSTAAARAGAGYVAVSTPGGSASGHIESVSISLPEQGWDSHVRTRGEKFSALVIGPGLAPNSANEAALQALATFDRPVVFDAGALDALGGSGEALRGRSIAAVLTPHAGEFERLIGQRVPADRLEATRDAANHLGSVVLLKGGPTIVADTDGRVLIVTSGDQRLATAGTGDVLSGIVGAALGGGCPPFEAAAYAAHLHGRLATAPHSRLASLGAQLIASDLSRPRRSD